MEKHKDENRKTSIKRSLWIFFAITFFYFFLIYRVVVIQAVNPEYFIEKSEINLTARKFFPARRGDIEDSKGNKLAVTIPLKKVCTNPYFLKDRERVLKVLEKYTDVPEKELRKKLAEENRYVVLAEKLPSETAEKIKQETKENMIWIEDDFLRVYPYGRLASHVIGFVIPANREGYSTYEGKEGAEYFYDGLLSGTPGYVEAQFYSRYGAIVPGTLKKKQEAKEGKNLVLTIDKDLQFFVEESIREAVKINDAKGACAIVMDSKTGEIYAMASYPDFDPNRYFLVENPDAFVNFCYRAVYEPGSTFKTFTLAAAINEGLITPDTVLYLPEKVKIGRYTIKEAHHRPAGSYTVSKIFQESMNIGALRIAEMLGPERFYEYVTCFRFGSKTGFDLSGEQKGRVLPPEEWKKTTLATMSFGQGISCTPLQMLAATNVFANGGFYVKPHIFKYSYDSETGSVQYWSEEKPVKIVSDRTVEFMKRLLVEVVEKGTGQKAQVTGYSVAGKTGTAQVPGRSGYEKGKYVSSFVGFVPAHEPRFSIIVVVFEPKKAHYGGTVAAPVFSKIADFAVKLYKIPPDLTEKQQEMRNRNTSGSITGD